MLINDSPDFDDFLVGTQGDDTIVGFSGAGVILGGGSNDLIDSAKALRLAGTNPNHIS